MSPTKIRLRDLMEEDPAGVIACLTEDQAAAIVAAHADRSIDLLCNLTGHRRPPIGDEAVITRKNP